MVTATEQENYEDFDMIERWEELNLDESLLRGIFAEGFEHPSFIQKRAIKPLLSGKDLRAQSQSGTGKTGAFCIAALSFVDPNMGTQVVVLAPTREIATQNYNCLKTFSKFMKNMNIILLLGGKEVKNDIQGLESNPHIVVGTPGRVQHMINKGYLTVEPRLFFIVDEADELFKRGFHDTIKDIFLKIKTDDTQVALFSATWEDGEIETSKKLLRDDAKIIDLRKDEQTLKGIDQYYVGLGNKKTSKEINDEVKIRILIDIFSNFDINQCIIFVNGVERVKNIYERLVSYDFPCGSIHSGLTQDEREEVFRKFKSGEIRTLISTDLVGRGVDVQQLSVVINFDLPKKDFSTYIHRIGRAGRYGRKGAAINFVFEEESDFINEICNHYRTNISPLTSDAQLK